MTYFFKSNLEKKNNIKIKHENFTEINFIPSNKNQFDT